MSKVHDRDTTILVVEDEQLLRLSATDEFMHAGFTVYSAGDADEAVQLACQHRWFDILFTDVHLPGSMDGLDLASKLIHEGRCGIVIYATGYQYDPPRMVSPSLFFRKPYSFQSVTNAAKQMAEVARQRHDPATRRRDLPAPGPMSRPPRARQAARDPSFIGASGGGVPLLGTRAPTT